MDMGKLIPIEYYTENTETSTWIDDLWTWTIPDWFELRWEWLPDDSIATEDIVITWWLVDLHCKFRTGNVEWWISILWFDGTPTDYCLDHFELPSQINEINVIEIWNNAFKWWRNLKWDLVIPETVLKIWQNAFWKSFTLDSEHTLTLWSNITRIGNWAFEENNFTGTLILPTGLTWVLSAFQNNHFNWELVIPAWITQIWGFNNNKFEKIDFSKASNLTGIYDSTFAYMNTLSGDLELPDSVETIWIRAFYRATNSSTTNTLKLWTHIETIDREAFEQCYFTWKLTLPDTLTSIWSNAFSVNHFNWELVIPPLMTKISNLTFHDNQFSQIDFNWAQITEIWSYGIWYKQSPDLKAFLLPNSITAISGSNGSYTWYILKDPSTITNESDITLVRLYTYTFTDNQWNILWTWYYQSWVVSDMDKLISIDNYINETEPTIEINSFFWAIPEWYTIEWQWLPDDNIATEDLVITWEVVDMACKFKTASASYGEVAWIKITWFSGTVYDYCLEHFEIPEEINWKPVLEIWYAAFEWDESKWYDKIKWNLIIPNSVISIKEKAFSNAFSWDNNTLTLWTWIKTIGWSAFKWNSLTGNLILPDTLTSMGLSTFEWNNFNGELIIPPSVEGIWYRTFYQNKFTSIDLSRANNLTTIYVEAFSDMWTVKWDLVIPDSVTKISSSAFKWTFTWNNNTLTLWKWLTSIDIGAFSENNFQWNIFIPSSITSLGRAVFKTNTWTTYTTWYTTDIKNIDYAYSYIKPIIKLYTYTFTDNQWNILWTWYYQSWVVSDMTKLIQIDDYIYETEPVIEVSSLYWTINSWYRLRFTPNLPQDSIATEDLVIMWEIVRLASIAITWVDWAKTSTWKAYPTGFTYDWDDSFILDIPQIEWKNLLWWKIWDSDEITPNPLLVNQKLNGKTLTAVWESADYTLTWNLNWWNRNWEMNQLSYNKSNEDIVLTWEVIRLWYTFTGWSGTDLDSPTMIITIPANATWDREYNANWEINTYRLTTTWVSWAQNIQWTAYITWKDYTVEDIIVLGNPKKVWAEFAWWEMDGEYMDTLILFRSTWDKTAKALWTCKEWYIETEIDGESQCIKNTFVVTFDPNEWAFAWMPVNATKDVTFTLNASGQFIPDINIQNPNKEKTWITGWMFDGWYFDKTYNIERTWFNDKSLDWKTVYAHWLGFEDKAITLSWITFTIMDRNLWASDFSSGYSYGDTNSNKIWKYYQRWNNFWFQWDGNIVKTWNQVDWDGYWPWNYYYNSTFIYSDWRWTFNDNTNLWWWENENNPDVDKQWPCPLWYHIPTKAEWDKTVSLFNSWKATEEWSGYCNSLDDGTKSDNKYCFNAKLWLPFGGLYNQGGGFVGKWNDARYRSSSRMGDRRGWLITNATVSYYRRVHWLNVRCFKNTTSKLLTFETNWWNINTTINSALRWWEAWTNLPVATNSDPNRIFAWWYTTRNFEEWTRVSTNAISTDDSDNTITLYAKWDCSTWYISSYDLTSCVPQSYSINYNLNGWNVFTANPSTWSKEDWTITLNNPFKQWYIFAWWFDSENHKLETISRDYMSGLNSTSLSLTAKYTPSTGTIYYVEHQLEKLTWWYSIEEIETLSGTTDAEITPAVKSYTWFTSPALQTTTISPLWITRVIYKYTRDDAILVVDYNWWKDDNENTSVTYNLEYGTPIDEIIPTRDGYTFAWWDKPYPKTMPAWTNNTITAQWTQNQYTITYNNVYDAVNLNTKYGYNYGESFTLSGAIKSWYVFSGWYTQDNWQWYKVTSISSTDMWDKVLYAYWTLATDTKYKVIHIRETVDQEINEWIAELIEIENLTWTTLASITPNTKTYTWFKSPVTQTVQIAADGSTVVKYVYSRKQYNFQINSVAWANTQWSSVNMKYFYEEPITISGSANRWYTWSWWQWLPDWVSNINNITFSMPASNVSITPVLNHLVYTISFNSNWWEPAIIPDQTWHYEDTLSLPEVVRNEYSFQWWYEWNNRYDGTTKLPDRDVQLKARWTPIDQWSNEILVSVKYFLMWLDGEYPAIPSDTLNLAITKWNRYTWYVKTYEWFTSPAEQSIIVSSGSNSIEYRYSRNKYPLTLNQATWFTYESLSWTAQYYYWAKITLNGTIDEWYTWSWWQWLWEVAAHSTIPWIEFTMPSTWLTVSPTVSLTTYKATFRDWEVKLAEYKVKYWAVIPTPANPSKDGYTFKWWKYMPADGKMPAEDVDIRAQWEENWWGGWGWGGWWWGGWWWGWGSSSGGGKWWSSSSKTIQTWDSHWSATGKVFTWTIKDLTPSTWDDNTDNIKPTKQTFEWSTEFEQAYNFAKTYKITTTKTIEKAKMNTNITRIQMAKMLSYYAINVLWKKPDARRWIPKFNDVSNNLNNEYDNAVILAYQLWIMWINMPNNNFRPYDEVTRAEFATALSRLLYKTQDWKYSWTKYYYQPHIAKLYNEWIITNTNPSMKEKRWYVMIMLMRSVK